MEGENLYKTSSEKKFLRKVAGDKDAPDVVSHSAQEDLARIKDQPFPGAQEERREEKG